MDSEPLTHEAFDIILNAVAFRLLELSRENAELKDKLGKAGIEYKPPPGKRRG